MTADFIIKTGDTVVSNPSFPPATVVTIPGTLIGTSTNMKVNNMPVCLEGDEQPHDYSFPMMYVTPTYVIPGTGTISVTLTPQNKTLMTKNGGKAILIKGSMFVAEFKVMSPAQQPTPGGPVPDATPSYVGSAYFVTTNVTVKAG